MSLNTALLNPTGLTANVVPAGNPYIIVTTEDLEPDEKAKVTLDFSVPKPLGNITYTPKVLSDGIVP